MSHAHCSTTVAAHAVLCLVFVFADHSTEDSLEVYGFFPHPKQSESVFYAFIWLYAFAYNVF